MRLKRIAAWFFSAAVFAVCAWYLYIRVSWTASLSVLLSADLWWLVGGGSFCVVGYFFVRALRWHMLITRNVPRSPFVASYFVTAISIGLALVTPGQVGEAVKIELMKRHSDLGRWLGAGGFVVERVIDMTIIGMIALAGVFIFGDTISVRRWGGPVALVVSVGLCVLVVLVLTHRFTMPDRVRDKLRHLALPPGTLARVATITLISWAIVGLGWETALRSVGISLAPAQTIWLVAIVIIAVIASLIPGGLGASEVVVVELLTLWGYRPEQALAGAIALRVFGLLIILIALLHFLLWSLVSRRSTLSRTAESLKQSDIAHP